MKQQKIVIRDPYLQRRVLDLIAGLNVKKPWLVTVQPYRKPRSLSQNALMWKWVGLAAEIVGEHTGYSADDMHEFFKMKFLPQSARSLVAIGDETVERRTTTKLNTLEMTSYMTSIERWCATDLGLMLPRPEDTQRYW